MAASGVGARMLGSGFINLGIMGRSYEGSLHGFCRKSFRMLRHWSQGLDNAEGMKREKKGEIGKPKDATAMSFRA